MHCPLPVGVVTSFCGKSPCLREAAQTSVGKTGCHSPWPALNTCSPPGAEPSPGALTSCHSRLVRQPWSRLNCPQAGGWGQGLRRLACWVSAPRGATAAPPARHRLRSYLAIPPRSRSWDARCPGTLREHRAGGLAAQAHHGAGAALAGSARGPWGRCVTAPGRQGGRPGAGAAAARWAPCSSYKRDRHQPHVLRTTGIGALAAGVRGRAPRVRHCVKLAVRHLIKQPRQPFGEVSIMPTLWMKKRKPRDLSSSSNVTQPGSGDVGTGILGRVTPEAEVFSG